MVPRHLPRLAVEAGSTGLWWKYVGEHGDVVGLDRFGESAPAGPLFTLFGITAEAVAERAARLVRPVPAVDDNDDSLESSAVLASN